MPWCTRSISRSLRGEFVSFLGPSGCGKTTTLQDGGRLRDPLGRGHPDRRAGRHPAAAQPAQCRHGLPVLRAVPQHDGRGQCRLRHEGGEAAAGRDREPRPGDAEPDQAAAAGRPLSLPALRRPAAARRPGPGPGGRAAGAAPGRAPLGPRRQDPHLAARGDPLAAAGSRHHHDLRHARPGGSPVDVGPHRGDERGPGRAGGPALRDLQSAADPLRRLVRRDAEHPRGQGARSQGRADPRGRPGPRHDRRHHASEGRRDLRRGAAAGGGEARACRHAAGRGAQPARGDDRGGELPGLGRAPPPAGRGYRDLARHLQQSRCAAAGARGSGSP